MGFLQDNNTYPAPSSPLSRGPSTTALGLVDQICDEMMRLAPHKVVRTLHNPEVLSDRRELAGHLVTVLAFEHGLERRVSSLPRARQAKGAAALGGEIILVTHQRTRGTPNVGAQAGRGVGTAPRRWRGSGEGVLSPRAQPGSHSASIWFGTRATTRCKNFTTIFCTAAMRALSFVVSACCATAFICCGIVIVRITQISDGRGIAASAARRWIRTTPAPRTCIDKAIRATESPRCSSLGPGGVQGQCQFHDAAISGSARMVSPVLRAQSDRSAEQHLFYCRLVPRWACAGCAHSSRTLLGERESEIAPDDSVCNVAAHFAESALLGHLRAY